MAKPAIYTVPNDDDGWKNVVERPAQPIATYRTEAEARAARRARAKRQDLVAPQRRRQLVPAEGLPLMTIEPGQRWISQTDGSVVVVDRKSDLLNRWWKVRFDGASTVASIDEGVLLAEYRLDATAS